MVNHSLPVLRGGGVVAIGQKLECENGVFDPEISFVVFNETQACIKANWWRSFDKKGWSTCKLNNTFITGFWRNQLTNSKNDGIHKLEMAKCCSSSKMYRGQSSKCQNADWWNTFDKQGTWSYCFNGYFLNGLYRTKGKRLHNIEEGKCCKPVNHPDKYGDCYDEDIGEKFNKKGWALCKRAGYYITGLYRGPGDNWLHSIDQLKCCKMFGGNYSR
ncbi:uncharacterized protein LOC124457205 [Xenia sp. Carnegie-2017]|uniref:uncharacterized protein LOC124457205 n=1 Tax=Xenia sp. Carnegie-2017 TaxID=2897299 RepID=UPI001F04384E|nr:uncharacterized protein LOC124457205 [Xenia sp. Carnegie-2017]